MNNAPPVPNPDPTVAPPPVPPEATPQAAAPAIKPLPKVDPKAPEAAKSPADSPTIDELPEDSQPKVSFWQSPFVQNILPFATSLVLHAGIIILGIATYKTVEKVVQVVKEQIIIPDATIVENGEVGGIPHPGLGGDPNRDAMQDQITEVPANSQSWADKQSENLNPSIGGGGAEGETASSLIGVGEGGSYGKGIGTANSGIGGDASGQIARFGPPGGGAGLGPKSNFIGVGGNAYRLVYVIDGTGSMVDKFDRLRMELKNAINGLKPVQSFNIIFYGNEGLESYADTLMPATPDHKQKAFAWLDRFSPRKNADVTMALKKAFDQKPQLMYLLTDGEFDMTPGGNDAIVNVINDRNRDKAVHVMTIAFLGNRDKSGYSPELADFLMKLAKDNGGRYKNVAADDY